MTRCVSRSLNHGVLGLRAAALLGALAMGTGCAQSIGDIDRTQPDLVEKKHFENGQWFIRETVVDVPPTSPTTMVGDMGDLEQIVWEIQQDWLVGYRSYEKIPGTDGTAASDIANPSSQPVTPGLGSGRNTDVYKGNPVVAYRIESHVDVQRTPTMVTITVTGRPVSLLPGVTLPEISRSATGPVERWVPAP